MKVSSSLEVQRWPSPSLHAPGPCLQATAGEQSAQMWQAVRTRATTQRTAVLQRPGSADISNCLGNTMKTAACWNGELQHRACPAWADVNRTGKRREDKERKKRGSPATETPVTMPHQMPLRRQCRGKVRVSPVGTPTAQKLIRLIHASAPCFPRPLQQRRVPGLRGSNSGAPCGATFTALKVAWSIHAKALQACRLH